MQWKKKGKKKLPSHATTPSVRFKIALWLFVFVAPRNSLPPLKSPPFAHGWHLQGSLEPLSRKRSKAKDKEHEQLRKPFNDASIDSCFGGVGAFVSLDDLDLDLDLDLSKTPPRGRRGRRPWRTLHGHRPRQRPRSPALEGGPLREAAPARGRRRDRRAKDVSDDVFFPFLASSFFFFLLLSSSSSFPHLLFANPPPLF